MVILHILPAINLKNLLQQYHLAGLNKIAGGDPVEVNPTSQRNTGIIAGIPEGNFAIGMKLSAFWY